MCELSLNSSDQVQFRDRPNKKKEWPSGKLPNRAPLTEALILTFFKFSQATKKVHLMSCDCSQGGHMTEFTYILISLLTELFGSTIVLLAGGWFLVRRNDETSTQINRPALLLLEQRIQKSNIWKRQGRMNSTLYICSSQKYKTSSFYVQTLQCVFISFVKQYAIFFLRGGGNGDVCWVIHQSLQSAAHLTSNKDKKLSSQVSLEIRVWSVSQSGCTLYNTDIDY